MAISSVGPLKVLLACGTGASTGFLAAAIRKAAKADGREVSVTARSETEVDAYASDVDLIMLGPHLAYLQEVLEKQFNNNPKIGVCEKSYYSKLDGKAALAHFDSIMIGG